MEIRRNSKREKEIHKHLHSLRNNKCLFFSHFTERKEYRIQVTIVGQKIGGQNKKKKKRKMLESDV